MCGGSGVNPQGGGRRLGLSPRVRGKPHRQRPRLYRAGSIPACAGEAMLEKPPIAPSPVYPRVCGGSPPAVALAEGGIGLSPRVRGKLVHQRGSSAAIRSIPACAGEAGIGGRIFRITGVYPRVCGGSVRASSTSSKSEGLSPRVRGKRPGSGCPARPMRSIPACAGEARAQSPLHPR